MRSSVFLVFALAICGCSRNHEPARDTSDEPKSNASPAAPPPVTGSDDRKVLVVFGDSIAAGFGLPAGRSFPDYLQKKLDDAGYMWRVVNLGISGDTTEGGVSRIDSATSLNPSIVVLELGGNDGLRGMPLASTR